MTPHLTESDWEELAGLIDSAPPGRIQVAIHRLGVVPSGATPRLVSGIDRLLHLATLSSGTAFDRALLEELRRLNVH